MSAGESRGDLSRPSAGAPLEQGELDANASLGLWFLLVSLTAFFAAALAGFLWARVGIEGWQPGLGRAQAPTLLAATVCLLGADLLIARGRRAPGARERARRLEIAGLLGVAYSVLQAWNWWVLAPVLRGEEPLAAFTFVVLTGVHAVHVIAGLGCLAFLLVATRRGAAGPTGLILTARYWRFLSVVWLFVLALLLAS